VAGPEAPDQSEHYHRPLIHSEPEQNDLRKFRCENTPRSEVTAIRVLRSRWFFRCAAAGSSWMYPLFRKLALVRIQDWSRERTADRGLDSIPFGCRISYIWLQR